MKTTLLTLVSLAAALDALLMFVMPPWFKFGDLMDVQSGIIIHGCNALGVMKSGVALAVRTKYPAAYAAYRRTWTERGLSLGEVITVTVAPGLYVCNAVTQDNYGREPGRRNVSYKAIETCFTEIARVAYAQGLPVHYPLIGAGTGGGDWAVIKDIIEEQLGSINHTLWIKD